MKMHSPPCRTASQYEWDRTEKPPLGITSQLKSQCRSCCSGSLMLQRSLQKRADVVAIDELERRLAHGVVAARKHHYAHIHPALPHAFNDVAGELRRERGVVAGVDEQ